LQLDNGVPVNIELEGAAHKLLENHLTNMTSIQQKVVKSAIAEYEQLVSYRNFLKEENRKLLQQLADIVRERPSAVVPKLRVKTVKAKR
jgi:hypothetical protein